jgi:hypothetical protein
LKEHVTSIHTFFEDLTAVGYNAGLATYFMLVSCFTYSSALLMEPMYSSKMLVDFAQTKRHYISEDKTLW